MRGDAMGTQNDSTSDTVAVVIGGSIAGALAAGVLAEHVSRVVVVERDAFPAEPGPRKGVPHAQHFHVLLARGRQIIEDVFPGFTDEAVARGATLTSMTRNCLAVRRYGRAPRFDSPMQVLFVSRELIEWVVRQRAMSNPRVEFLSSTESVGLLVEDGRTTGIQLREAGTDEVRVLPSDLVVDASGRSSNTPAWLEAAGYAVPDEIQVNAHWGYSSCFVNVPEGFDPGFFAFSALPKGQVA